jgi:hypothetical protein
MKNCFAVLFIFSYYITIGQNQKFIDNIEVSYLKGNALPHTEDMHHLINGHPNGIMINSKEWHETYNYPDFGGYFLYQDFKSNSLGENYSIGALYNFYFLNRNLQFKIGQGLALCTNPYDKVENSKNRAFGSKIITNTNFGLSYDNQNLFKNIGFHAGILFTHYSNGRVKSPNLFNECWLKL